MPMMMMIMVIMILIMMMVILMVMMMMMMMMIMLMMMMMMMMMMIIINIVDRNMNIVEAELFDADLIFFASLCFSELFMEHALQSIGRYMENIDDKDDDDGGISSYDDDDDDDDVIDDTSINRHQHNFRLLQHTIMTSTRTNIHHTYIHTFI